MTKKLKTFFHTHESTISFLTLAGGFIFDTLTLQRVDFFTDNIFIIFYLIMAGACIIVMDLHDDGKLKGKFASNLYEFLPFMLQFCFGGLFSAFVIFYSKSAAISSSGAFVLILAVLLVGNEFFKKHYSKLVFQTSIYFIAVFSFFIYFLPVVLTTMGDFIFLLSGLLSILFIWGFIFVVYYLTPERYADNHKFLIVTISLIYISINILYFKNIIPPIPLSLKEGDVYHFVERKPTGNYQVVGEVDSWQEKLGVGQKLHLSPFEPAYVFSSIFAPTDLDTTIVHDWQYFDEEKDEWISVTKIVFPIKGGRAEGYRGFSKKENIYPGLWRVDIKTQRGQVIGRVKFDIEISETKPALNTESL